VEHTLPYSWYSDPEILRREQAQIFRSAWQYAGHLGQLPEPGTFFTGRAGRMPVVVTRARDGELRAFLNVCRHRGFPVASGEGRRETLQCPYHIFPGRPNISIGPVVPLTPERSYRFLDYFFGPDVDQAWIDDLMAFHDQVGREDRALVEGVQRGVTSGALEHGHLMSRSEQLIGHFQQLTAAALAD
jgi:phenylpropionate dioxygenase-like ring-hydroxylating dioxygenase large terminal subunit